jgi:FAD/FMN-containing dehydrogenase
MNRHRGRSLLAAEVMDDTSMELGMRLTGLPYPLRQRHPVVVLLEIADDPVGLHVPDDTVIACDADDRARLWRYREGLGEAYSALGVVHRFDVSVPLDRIPEWIDHIRPHLADDPTVQTFGFFGHIADGNIHLEVHGPSADDQDIDDTVFTSVAQWGGSISAEHGIGRAKTQYLSMVRSAAEIDAMRAIKRAWDPHDLMNPGVLFPATAVPG